MEMPDITWQHQKYARPEIYVATLVEVSRDAKFSSKL